MGWATDVVRSGTLIVVGGPSLPGRFGLARLLERELGARRFSLHGIDMAEPVVEALGQGAVVLVDGDLAHARERRRYLGLARPEQRLLVEWRCSRAEAEREIFHRYAGRPRALEQCELDRYLADAQVREPPDGLERMRVLTVGPAQLPGEHLRAVRSALPQLAQQPLVDGHATVLLVEDDPEERAVLAEVLRELGWSVEVAPDAAVALALLDELDDVELVLSDQRMPGMSGVELVRIVEERRPEVRAVLLTAYGDDATCEDALRARALTVLAKPVHILDLQRVLEP